MLARNKTQYDELTTFREERGREGSRFVPANDMILFVGTTGAGKSLAMEKTIHDYYRQGYTIIHLTDVKMSFETCFASMPKDIVPEFHRFRIEDIDKMQFRQIPLKIYHPYSFNVPKRKVLPKIQFFTVPIESLAREHFSFLSETKIESETVKLMMASVDKLKKNEGLYPFIHNIFEMIEEKTSVYHGRKIRKTNPEFHTTVKTSGTTKDAGQIESYFRPFKTDYFLAESNCPHNIDFKKMINDQKHYHCLTYKWIKDKKIRYFTILCWLLGIVDVLEDYAKNPVCLVIEEIRYLCPDKATGFENFLANIIKEILSVARATGRGTTIIASSQEFFDIQESLRNSFSEKLFGRLAQIDIERLGKTHGWNQQRRQDLTEMDRNHFHRLGDKENDEYILCFPPHPHREEKMSFMNLYHRYFPFNETKYSDLHQYMKKKYNVEDTRSKKMAEKRERSERENIKRIEENREEQSKSMQKLKELEAEQKKSKFQTKQELMKKCYELYYFEGIESFRKIGERLGITAPTVRTYILKYKKLKEDIESRPKL